jgi:hypothetical protein
MVQRGSRFGVECGSALLCRFGFSSFSLFSLEQTPEARAAEQSTAALHTTPPPPLASQTKAGRSLARQVNEFSG